MRRALLVVVALALGAGLASAEDATLIRGARIVTVSGPVIEKGSILIEKGQIAAVGAELVAPPGATIVEAAGKTVYPGLIDALTRLGLTEIDLVRASVDSTEVGELNPHARAWVALHPHSQLIPVARAGGVTAALAAPAGGLVSGQSALIRLAGTTPEAMTLLGPAALHVVWPSGNRREEPGAPEEKELEKRPEKRPLEKRLEERKKNVERDLQRLRNLLEEAKAYDSAQAATAAGKGTPPKPDPVLEALVAYAKGELPVVIRADMEEEIRGAVTFASERGLRLIVAGGLEAWRCVDMLKQKDAAVLVKVLRLPARRSDSYDAAYANAAILGRAGVRFAIVTDDDSNVRNLPYEAAMAHAFGLPADAAVRAITLAPAELLGAAGRLGSIEPGKDANLVVASGDILDHRTQVTHVFVAGTAQPLETKHTRLYEQFKDRP